MFENLVLLGRQMNDLVACSDIPIGEIDGEVLRHKRGECICRRIAAQSSADACEQLLDTEWLDDVIVRSSVQGGYLVPFRITYRQHDDRRIRTAPNLAASLNTTHSRHIHV